MLEEPRPLPKLEIYFIVEGQIPKFALNIFFKKHFLTLEIHNYHVGWLDHTKFYMHTCKYYLFRRSLQKFLIWRTFLLHRPSRNVKKGIPQRYPYKKRWYVNEINFFSKNVIIELHATHHFVSLWGAQRSKASFQWLWKNLLHNICKSRGSHL